MSFTGRIHRPQSAVDYGESLWSVNPPARMPRSLSLPGAVPGVVALCSFIAAWELWVRAKDVPAYIMPPPSAVVLRLIVDAELLGEHAAVTLSEILLGFAVGSGFGFVCACLMGYSRTAERAIFPFVVSSQTFPKEALAPLLLVWLGFGIAPKVAVSALICFFPVVVNGVRGLTSVDPLALDLFRSLSATPLQVLIKLRLPHSLPYFLAALKMAVTLSVIGAVVGEFVGASAGLGYLIQVANSQLATDLTFAALLLLGALSYGLFTVVAGIEKVVLRRHGQVSYGDFR